MDYSKFISAAPGGSFLGYRRAFTNWVVERQRLIDSQKAFRLHRLAAKRIVFEIEGMPLRSSNRRFASRSLVAIAVLLTVGGATSALVASDYRSVSAHKNADDIATANTAPASCSQISLVGRRSSSIQNFDVSGWNVSTNPMAVDLGELQGFTFEATCLNQTLRGRLIAVQAANGWQIKRMVLVD